MGLKLKKGNEAVGIEVNLEITTDKFFEVLGHKVILLEFTKLCGLS